MRSAENWLQKHAQSWSLMYLLSDAGDTVGNGLPLPTSTNRVNEHYWTHGHAPERGIWRDWRPVPFPLLLITYVT